MKCLSEPQCICFEQGNSSRLFSVGEHEVRQCNRCGQVYVTGIDLDTVQAEYDESQYFLERNSYLNRWEELTNHFDGIIDRIKRFKVCGDFLDVGCSVGILLCVAKKNDYNVKGVEVSRWASEFAREKGFNVVTGGLVEAGYPNHSFDIVVLNHVLEHLPDPVAILNEAWRILKDDGLLVVGVPNFGCYLAQTQKSKWSSLMPDQHIWQFTHESLANLLDKCCFKEVFFESKDNHKINYLSRRFWIGVINLISKIRNNSEAMLIFANKRKVRENHQ